MADAQVLGDSSFQGKFEARRGQPSRPCDMAVADILAMLSAAGPTQ